MKKVIYDFGANVGDNLPYYLKKADKVVAVEAHPGLTEHLKRRFEHEIAEGRLVVINCILADKAPGTEQPFFINLQQSVVSSAKHPIGTDPSQCVVTMINARKASDIIAEHGEPYFVKIDLEGSDEDVLRELFSSGVRPQYISAESHDVNIFAALVAIGGYNSFKLVDGQSVGVKFNCHTVQTAQGPEVFSFLPHSAGPFGEDIPGPWLAAEDFLYLLASERLGWKDIHATNAAGC